MVSFLCSSFMWSLTILLHKQGEFILLSVMESHFGFPWSHLEQFHSLMLADSY